MNKLLEEKVRQQILRYKKKPSDRLRDAIFFNLRPYIVATLKTGVRLHKRYRTEEELLSMSWDVFLEGLDVFTRDSEVRGVFGARAILSVKRMVKQERFRFKRTMPIDLTVETALSDDSQQIVMTPFMDLRSFRESLPQEYRIAFDDTLFDLSGESRKRKEKITKCPLPKARYYEAKNVFRLVVQFFLGEGRE